MIVNLTPQHEALIREKVESGLYASSSDVVREALRLLEERDNLARLRAAVAVGQEQIRRGEGIPFTESLMDQIDREVDVRSSRGDQPSSDVCP